MNIEDVRVNQRFIDKDGNTRIVASVNDAGMIRDKENNIHFVKAIQRVPDKLYTQTDVSGHMNLCIDTPAGKLMADVDEYTDAGYTAMYLSLLPENATDSVDIVAIKNQEKDLQVKVWGNFGSLDTTDEFLITESEIKNVESED